MDADRGREPRCLLDDGALTEDIGVEPGRFVGGAVAPDGRGNELIHVDTVPQPHVHGVPLPSSQERHPDKVTEARERWVSAW